MNGLNSFSRFYTFYQIVIKKSDLKNDKILDYGCYQGAFLFAWENIWCKVIGTDLMTKD